MHRLGRRLAALSLAGHPDPGRFAEEFSGSERMVAEYLLAEVLERARAGRGQAGLCQSARYPP
jgi:ATP/maltotriose-dependent transcriptional regulator MalT